MTNDMPLPVADKLSPCPWAGDVALGRVLDTLNNGGVTTRIVGGAVRNAVMGRPVADYDLTTALTPDAVTARAVAAGLKVVPTGIDHGTVTVVAHKRGFEVTTLRRDVATDGRHAVVQFTDDWIEDARRRDFSLNTLLADYDGTIYDPLGTGLADARAGLIRFVGDPAARIVEDYLRILRFFRFQAHYGSGDMDTGALDACRQYAPQMRTLSRERVTTEVMKWLGAENPIPSLKKSIEYNVLNVVLESIFDVQGLSRLIPLQRAVNAVDICARLHALASGAVDKLVDCFVLSSNQIKFLRAISDVIIQDVPTPQNLRAAVYTHGLAPVIQRVLINMAAAQITTPPDFTDIQKWVVPAMPVTGGDLIALGYTPGVAMGDLLRVMERAWVESDFTLSRDALLALRL